jgi:hypothetical protein
VLGILSLGILSLGILLLGTLYLNPNIVFILGGRRRGGLRQRDPDQVRGCDQRILD